MTKKEFQFRRSRVEKFLKKRHQILNVLGLERELNFPIGTIQKFINNDRIINDHRIKRIDAILTMYFKDWSEEL